MSYYSIVPATGAGRMFAFMYISRGASDPDDFDAPAGEHRTPALLPFGHQPSLLLDGKRSVNALQLEASPALPLFSQLRLIFTTPSPPPTTNSAV